ncbi:NAD(P)/FAD-dependent oxidoreductase [Oricola thermophila]|uniref:FAD-binding oxidoreductase n=1 Tax=Oricola thermophila TaxID=2742145 RepID=A0A6N1VAT2_9HYPH|nr:FAD-dependent oxidoreductase [Oricola thermophila]QKV17768.1 FAD-binding oxidoreductase [Oricola thermophila]
MPVSVPSPDIAVVGGGIVGLWTAYRAARQGLSVLLFEKRRIGAGASGGVMGALMPHQPTGWNEKKQFQLDALVSLEEEIREVEAFSELPAGYRRCGRVMPIRNLEKRRQSAQWVEASRTNWPFPYSWSIVDAMPNPAYLPQGEMPFGANSDNLSARVDPRRLAAALTGALGRLGVEFRQGTGIAAIGRDGTLALESGEKISAGHAVLCAGWESFSLLSGHFVSQIGQGVKGQAALLRPAAPIDPASPILFDSGTYVIVHETGDVAVGSTSENEFGDPHGTDAALEDVIAAARRLCPLLENAQVLERWAGIRPRAAGREPLVGPLPGFANVSIATGGFKIGFGIAHLMAEAVITLAGGERPGFLPGRFLPENRLRA